MTRHEKVLQKVLRGTSDANVGFEKLCDLMRRLGVAERHRGGSHRIFHRDGVAEILKLQPRAGGGAKPYQVRQVAVAGCARDGGTPAATELRVRQQTTFRARLENSGG